MAKWFILAKFPYTLDDNVYYYAIVGWGVLNAN